MSYKEIDPLRVPVKMDELVEQAYKELKPFFEPESIAVIGASRDEWSIGWVVFKNLAENYKNKKLKARIYGVNVKGGELFGYKLYKSIMDIPDSIDHAVIVVPAKFVLDVVEECGKKGVKALTIISAGFSEIGNTELENKVIETARKYGMRIIGPNCLGVFDNFGGVDTLFTPEFKKYYDQMLLTSPRPKPGVIMFGSQSGALGLAILDALYGADIGIAKFVSYGNKADVDETDLLLWSLKDPYVDVIMLYIEGIKKAGRLFVEVAKEVSKKKPIVVLKGGRTQAGARAAESHTGSLAGDYKMYIAAFKKIGAVVVETLDEFIDTVKAFSTQPPARGYNLAIITDGGGAGLLAADAAEKYGLIVNPPSDELLTRLKDGVNRGYIVPFATFANPIDITGSATDESFVYALEAVLDDKNTDSVMIIGLHHVPGVTDQLPKKLVEVIEEKDTNKPVAFCTVGGADYAVRFRKSFEEAGIPTYPTPERAALVLKNLADYGSWLASLGLYESYIKEWKERQKLRKSSESH
ncbi:MAG: CoA-binding protein [Candidatus Korarchaeota archaeon]